MIFIPDRHLSISHPFFYFYGSLRLPGPIGSLCTFCTGIVAVSGAWAKSAGSRELLFLHLTEITHTFRIKRFSTVKIQRCTWNCHRRSVPRPGLSKQPLLNRGFDRSSTFLLCHKLFFLLRKAVKVEVRPKTAFPGNSPAFAMRLDIICGLCGPVRRSPVFRLPICR